MNPSSRWPIQTICFWIVLSALIGWWRGPAFRRAFVPDYHPSGSILFLPDFFQEWASARNRLNGLPIYTSQGITLERYLQLSHNPNHPFFIEFNAHPPSAVLLGLPFAGLDFADAFALWNVLSLLFLAASAWLIVRELHLPFSPWDLLPAITLMLLCYPFWHQMVHGQLNLLLLLLLTASWAADRRGHPHWAGTLVGLAVAIKLFPGFVFVYFVFRREWTAVRTGLLALAGITALTCVLIGPETYPNYFLEVLPRTSQWRMEWPNLSLSGVWCKLFEPSRRLYPIEIVPLAQVPVLAFLGMAGTLLAVTAILAAAAACLRSARDWDLLFALTMVGMLLVSPITWDHYLLLLLLPVVVVWQRLPRGGIRREVVGLLLALLCVEARLVVEHGLILLDAAHSVNDYNRWVATPLETLTALSIPCYALVGLFVLALAIARKSPQSRTGQAIT